VWLLGGFHVSVGSRKIGEDEWRLRKAVSLFKLLALSPGHRMHREVLMDRLWPELGRRAATNNLRHALHVSRRVLASPPTTPSPIGNWDKPDPWDHCPLPLDHGSYQWVNVSPSLDTGPPTVKNVSPAHLATGIAPATNVAAVFSEPMRANTVNTTNVRLKKAGATTSVQATVSYDATNKRAVLNPNTNLVSGATYVASVATGVRDVAGNALDQNPNLTGNQPKVWKFKVK
jgi:Bacterial Ig-like domain